MKTTLSFVALSLSLLFAPAAYAIDINACTVNLRGSTGMSRRDAKKSCKCMERVLNNGYSRSEAAESCTVLLLNGRL